jgi:CBS domain-containing protein
MPAIAADDTLHRVMELGFERQQHDFPVIREGTLVGILSREDMRAAVRSGSGYMKVAEAMRRDFPIISPDDLLLRAQQLIAQTGLNALPVFDRDYFLGLITVEDINLSWRRR